MNVADQPTGSSRFPTTQWTLLINAIQKGDEPTALAALAAFCRGYRRAIYSFFRRRGCNHEDAEDHTHNFFTSRVFERWDDRDGILHTVLRDEERKFRTFLATRLWWFLKDEWTKQRAQKAGGALDRIPLEDLDKSGEGADLSASKLVGRDFDRAFAVETITKAVQRATRSKSFLSYFVTEHTGKGMTQEEAAAKLGMTVGAFKKNYHEFRKRLKTELFREVGKYAGPGKREIEVEIRYLMALYVESSP
jgi:DNA-directed RNA polymerase specialized sigma24 family protein